MNFLIMQIISINKYEISLILAINEFEKNVWASMSHLEVAHIQKYTY